MLKKIPLALLLTVSLYSSEGTPLKKVGSGAPENKLKKVQNERAALLISQTENDPRKKEKTLFALGAFAVAGHELITVLPDPVQTLEQVLQEANKKRIIFCKGKIALSRLEMEQANKKLKLQEMDFDEVESTVAFIQAHQEYERVKEMTAPERAFADLLVDAEEKRSSRWRLCIYQNVLRLAAVGFVSAGMVCTAKRISAEKILVRS